MSILRPELSNCAITRDGGGGGVELLRMRTTVEAPGLVSNNYRIQSVSHIHSTEN